MPTRSIKLKLIVPRGGEQLATARALWTTHAVVNAAARYYERNLLLMRGRWYRQADGRVTEETVCAGLRELVHAARARNPVAEPISDEEAIDLLGRLYTAIAPSAAGEKGSAQAANGFLGPLVDPDSRGGLGIFDKIGTVPDWVEAVRAAADDGRERAMAWLASGEGQARLRMTGAPAGWIKAYRKGDAGWPELFVADLDRKLREVEGTPSVIQRLKRGGILPLFPPCVAPRLIPARGSVSPWDRLALRLAVAHLLSWESWERRAAEEHTARKSRFETFRAELLAGPMAGAVAALRRYEDDRRAELERVALPMGDRPFLITQRMARGWADLRAKWQKTGDRSEASLLAIAAAEQTRLRGRFGDPHLAGWLAQPGNRALWAEPGPDVVEALARLNGMERLVERSHESATMTLPDARAHPRCVQWEAAGGSNLRQYELRRGPDGTLHAILPLLTETVDGALVEETVTVALAPSAQFQDVAFGADSRRGVSYRGATGESMTGTLGSADLLLDWGHLRAREEARIGAGDIGPAWLKIAIDVQPMPPAGFDVDAFAGAFHFQTALGQKSRHQDKVAPGLRVLAVDLGLRDFATASVFTLRATPDGGHPAFALPDLGLWAVHERSFPLRLPGEAPDRRGGRWQAEAAAGLRRLRRGLRRHRLLLQAALAAPGEREAAVAVWRDTQETGDGWPFETPLCERLAGGTGLPAPLWEEHVRAVAHDFRRAFGAIVRDWRRQARMRGGAKASGKSAWAIQHLTDQRRFLQGWSLAGRRSGEIRRLDRTAAGVYARHLLDHIEGLKDDRLKTGADLIVQAARGFRRGRDGRWMRAHEPCHIVLFEDLSRYRMRTDRPRRENSQLMKWAHRAVPQEVAMQGELYGLRCLDTGAAFSSRYRAATMTPGIRCHPVTATDLQDSVFTEVLLRENAGIDPASLRPGDLVPLAGGEIFACLDADGRLCRLHADVNAAQNLQRRFWTRHGDAFRIPARRILVDGESCWVPTKLGKRLLGALGGFGRLVPTGHDTGSCRWEALTPRRWRALAGDAASAPETLMGDPDLEELLGLEEEALERSGETVVFFRDPSGVVLPAGLWFPSVVFWSIVKTRTAAALVAGTQRQ